MSNAKWTQDAFFHIYSAIIIEEGKDHEFERGSWGQGGVGEGEDVEIMKIQHSCVKS